MTAPSTRTTVPKSPNVADVYELTPLQRGILFHTLYAPDSGVYIEQAYLTLGGRLDHDSFWRAWQTVIDRHPALRSTFHWDGITNPVQTVHRRVTLERREEDWRDVPEEDRQRRVEELLLAERRRGFDLERPPLLKIALLRLAADRYYVAWQINHLIADGWSFGVILGEFIAAYKDYFHGRTPRFGEPGRFRDYVSWWNRQEPDQVAPYWRARLAGYTPPDPLDLGAAEGVDAGEVPYERVERSLAGIADGLRGFSAEHRLSLHTLIQGAWMLVLRRCGGGDEIMVGATMAHRPTGLRNGERIVGPMVVTLPIRSAPADDRPLLDWLAEIQDAIVSARDHAGAPLTDIQGWSPVPRSADLFESIVSFENVPIPDIAFPDEGLELLDYTFDGRPQYPLSFVVLPGDDLPLRLIYDRRRFRRDTASLLLERVEEALRAMLADPHRTLGEIDVLTGGERAVLAERHRPSGPVSPVEHGLHKIVAEHARTRPDAVALSGADPRDALTYRQLDECANRLARHLADRGVVPGDRVAICAGRHPRTVAAMLGVLKCGAAFVPLDPAHPAGRRARILADSGAKLLLTESTVDGFDEPRCPVLRLDTDEAAIARHIADPIDPGTRPDADAYVVYTSGSTGEPKGVVMTHANVVRLVRSMDDIIDVGPDDVWTCLHTFAFDASVWEIWGALLHGSRLVVVASETARAADALHSLLRAERVTVALQTPRAFEQLIAVDSELDDATRGELALRYFLTGADRVEPTALRPWFDRRAGGGPVVLNVYGPTETTVFCTSHRITWEETTRPAAPSNIGRPVADTAIYLLDDQLRPVPLGVTGEIYISGPGLGRGYLNRPELTARAFVPDPFAGNPEARMYRTGDLARYDEQGEIEYLGRRDDQVKIRGYRVELGEIESVLRAHPGVRKAAAVRRTSDTGDVRLVACVAGDEDIADTESMLAFLRERLPEYMIPAAIVTLPDIPVNANGKLDTTAIPDLDERTRPDGHGVAPRTETERHLAALMADLLGLDQVGVEDNLVDLGLHSLLVTKVVSGIRRQWKVSVPLRALFETPTVAELAKVIESGGSEAVLADRPGAVDLAAEVTLPDEIRPSPDGGRAATSPEHIFLTGATGFLGGALLARLLRDTGATLHCLVRAESAAEGAERITASLRSLGLWDPEFEQRIVPVLGDLARPGLGMDPDTFAELAQIADQIHHCGAEVNFLYPYRRLRASNVGGTVEVLRLAATGPVTPVHYVSTGAVLGQLDATADDPGPVPEAELAATPPLLSSGYAQSKWVAERIVTVARDRGLPVTIHRSGRVTGDSRTGRWKTGDATTEMLRASAATGLVPDFDGAVDMTPVDYVCAAISAIAGAPDSGTGRILHLTNPKPVTISEVAAGLEQAGYAVRVAAVADWYAALVRLAREDTEHDWQVAVAVLGTWVQNHQNDRREPLYDSTEAQALLGGPIGDPVTCPPVDSALIATYLRHLAEIGYLVPPDRRETPAPVPSTTEL